MSLIKPFLILGSFLVFAMPALAELSLPGTSKPIQLPSGKFIDQTKPANTPISSLPGAYLIPLRADADGRIFPDGEVRVYLQGIVDKLQKAWPHSSRRISVEVSSSFFPPADYHAQAHPDNAVVIFLGILEQAETEDELAFILAHELSHILLGHLSRDEHLADTRKSARMAVQMSRMAGTLSSIDYDARTDSGVPSMSEEEAEEKRAKAQKYRNEFRDGMADIFIPFWSRKHEDEADLLAIDLMAAAGYAPMYAQLVFERLSQAAVERENRYKALIDGYEEYIDSLPPETVENKLGSMVEGDWEAQSRSMGESIYEKVKDDVFKLFKSSLRERMAATHREPEERMQGLMKYIEREYPGTMDRDPSADSFIELREKEAYANLLMVREAILETRTQLAIGELALGRTALKPAMSGKFDLYAEGRWLYHQMLRMEENNEAAVQSLSHSAQSRHPGVRVYEKMFVYHWQMNEHDQALAWISRGESRFGDQYHFLPERIFAAAQKESSYKKMAEQCDDSKKDYLQPICVAAQYAAHADFRDYYAEIYCNREAIAAAQKDKEGQANQDERKSGGIGGALGGMFGGVVEGGVKVMGDLGDLGGIVVNRDGGDGC